MNVYRVENYPNVYCISVKRTITVYVTQEYSQIIVVVSAFSLVFISGKPKSEVLSYLLFKCCICKLHPPPKCVLRSGWFEPIDTKGPLHATMSPDSQPDKILFGVRFVYARTHHDSFSMHNLLLSNCYLVIAYLIQFNSIN